MKADDESDDILLGAIPDPDDEPSAAERAHAKSFGELVDSTLLGRPLPPAMSADERALIEVATVIRAGSGGMHLAPSAQRSIVEDALKKAIGEPTRSAELPAVTPPAIDALAEARAKRRVLPWLVSGVAMVVAAAAVIVMLVRTPTVTSIPTVPVAVTPIEETSRPTDALIGPIDKRDAGAASTRIDTIFADRLSGFRDRTLGGRR